MIKEARHNSPALEAVHHLYLHVPFCARICPYCAFYKERGTHEQAQDFCEALLRELDEIAGKFPIEPHTIFFGGGTPTALSTTQLEMVLRGFREGFDLSHLREWTVEANPGSVSPRKAELLRRFGVDRISMGVQSWSDDLLRVLGREHNAAQAEESFRILRDAGFENLNIDLMFGLPGQTLDIWRDTLARTIALQPEHVSTYCLTFEEDTDFFLRHARGELRGDSEADAQFFETAMQMLPKAGYQHYEISNYARAGFASAHNRGYWAGENYLGLGPSAFSTVGLRRWQNVSDFREYARSLFAGESAVRETEILTTQMKRGETIALSLRTNSGVAADLLQPWPNERDEFVALGLMRQENGRCLLTNSGKLVADSVAAAFI